MTRSPSATLRTTFAALLVGASTVATAAITVSAEPAAVVAAVANGSKTDQLIVTFAESSRLLSNSEIRASAGNGAVSERPFGPRSQIVKLPDAVEGEALETVMQALARRPGVVEVAPDQVMHLVTNDTHFARQWDLSSSSAGPLGINIAAAWQITTGSPNIKVAVLDTGYLDHVDLNGRLVAGYDFISDSRIGNDGNGRDSDAHDPGDWILSSETTAGSFFEGCPVRNSSWHGSHVSGTIGAATNNGVGIAGINPTSPIVPVRVLGKCGGYTSDIVDGMRWAVGLPVYGVPTNTNRARVLSLSLGSRGSCSSAWQDAIDDVNATGAVVVVAAGNSNADAANYSPASCDDVITVAATGKSGNRAYYSNYGATIEIAAPGGDSYADGGDTILSTVNIGTTSPIPGGDSYARYQGTSMATPHVSGVVSLMLSADPNLTTADVVQLLHQTMADFPAGSTCMSMCGAGLADAGAAVSGAANVEPPSTTTAPRPTNAPTTTTRPAPPTTAARTTTTTAPTTTAPPPSTTTLPPPPIIEATTTTMVLVIKLPSVL